MLVVDAVARSDAIQECSISNVAETSHVAHSTASRLVERAARAGMLHRGRSTTDPRRTGLSLTAAGWRLQREAIGFRTGRLDALLSDWSAGDVTTFTRLLERFARCAHAPIEETQRRSQSLEQPAAPDGRSSQSCRVGVTTSRCWSGTQ